jgi:hypothetical protein
VIKDELAGIIITKAAALRPLRRVDDERAYVLDSLETKSVNGVEKGKTIVRTVTRDGILFSDLAASDWNGGSEQFAGHRAHLS